MKAEPDSPQAVEPPSAEPSRPAEPSQQAEPVSRRTPAEEVPVPLTPDPSRDRGRGHDRRRDRERHERSSSVRSVKGKGKGKSKGKGKQKGKAKDDKPKHKNKSRAKGDGGRDQRGDRETPRSAASAPAMSSYQHEMYGSWYNPEATRFMQGPQTGWYQDWRRQWWYWSGTDWWIAPEDGQSWPSTTTSRTIEGSSGKGSGQKGDKDEERSKKEEKRSRRKEEAPKPMKKAKPEPPDGDDGGDDGGDSEYTYEYEEEEPEEEGGTNDPSVAPSTARGDGDRRRPRTPDRGPRGRRGDASEAGTASTARTSEIQEMLQSQMKRNQQDRSKPSISQVKLETFRGSRSHFKDWKKILEAQQALYRLEEHELAMLVYLSCEGEARQILNQMEVSEMQEPGGLQRIMRLLEDSYGSRAEERFEERQEAYSSFRRTPGMSVAAYISTLKRLRQEYLKEDPGTTLSDRSFAQRLLSRAALTRRERYDIFFAAGGKYASVPIEQVMRFRCQYIHQDEKKQSAEPRRKVYERGRSTKHHHRRHHGERQDRRAPHRPSRHSAHVADYEDEQVDETEDEDELDNEDFEKEALLERDDNEPDEEDDLEDEEDEDYEENEDEQHSMKDAARAFVQGWKAKSQSAEARKSRGYKAKGKGKGKRPPDERKVEDRKRNSTCASCGQKGHWHGDAECPNVKSGKDKPRSSNFAGVASSSTSSKRIKQEPKEEPRDGAKDEVKQEEDVGRWTSGVPQPKSKALPDVRDDKSGLKVSKVNWTFMVGGWDLVKDQYGSGSSEVVSSSDEEADDPRDVPAFPVPPRPSSKSKPAQKYQVSLKVVMDSIDEAGLTEEVLKKLKKKERKMKEAETTAVQPDVRMPGQRPVRPSSSKKPSSSTKQAAVTAEQAMSMLPHMSKQEKKELYRKLKADEEAEAMKNYPDYTHEDVKRRESKQHGYSAPKARAAPEAASSSAGPPPAVGELPEPVRKRRMQEFRWRLYEGALNRKGGVKPSEASSFPLTPQQEQCLHPFKQLTWRGNGAAHWCNCRGCGLKKVLYYSMDHGSLVSQIYEESTTFEATLAEKGEVILDSGCRTAVAGQRWHQEFQDRLRSLAFKWHTVEHDEIFRFGAGAPIQSTRAHLYPVCPGGGTMRSWLRLAVVDRTSQDDRVQFCPALVGPSEMARWKVQLDFGAKELQLGNQRFPMEMSHSHHPVLSLVGEKAERGDWESEDMRQLLRTLSTDPYSMALLEESLNQAAEEDDPVAQEKQERYDLDEEEVVKLAMWQEEMEMEAIAVMDELHPHLPPECFLSVVKDENDESSTGSLSEGESETTHGGSDDLSEAGEPHFGGRWGARTWWCSSCWSSWRRGDADERPEKKVVGCIEADFRCSKPRGLFEWRHGWEGQPAEPRWTSGSA